MKKLISVVMVGLFSAVFISEDVLSQDNPAVSNRQIDEIIVTSRKTEENIQDVPVAVYAVDEKALDDFRPTTMRDLDSMAPNLQIGMNTASGNQGAIFVRGCGTYNIWCTIYTTNFLASRLYPKYGIFISLYLR